MNFKLSLPMVLLALFWVTGAAAFQCSVATTPVNFGFYDLYAMTDLNSTGSITITCNNPPQNPLPLTVILNAGNSGSFAQRQMTSTSGGRLIYNLYSDAARSQILGDGSGGSVNLATVISKVNPWSATVYGRIPALQNVVPGVYGDSITATVLW